MEPQSLFFCRSSQWKQLYHTVKQYADTDRYPVLLSGETGVGKERFAELLHTQSPRAEKPLLRVNCGALPPQLFESELFGHERGSFTGAHRASKGLIREAEGGTLFLDEIGELALPQQVKLLRFIENYEVRALGSTQNYHIDVRIIAATNKPLRLACSQGRFRCDLFERLSVLTLEIPPLRDHAEDIPDLASHFLQLTGSTCNRADLEVLTAYHWPGNIRELRNFILRVSVLQGRQTLTQDVLLRELHRLDEACVFEDPRGAIFHEQLASQSKEGMRAVAQPQDYTLESFERYFILGRLAEMRGNRKKTALALGIAKSTLHDKLKKWSGKHETSSPLSP